MYSSTALNFWASVLVSYHVFGFLFFHFLLYFEISVCQYTSCFQLLLTFQLFISVQSLTLESIAQLLYFPFSRPCCLHKNNPCRHALLLLVFCCTLCAFVFLLLLTGCEWSFAYFVGSCFWSSICKICLPEWLTFHVWPQPGNTDLIFPSILCCMLGCEPFVSHS